MQFFFMVRSNYVQEILRTHTCFASEDLYNGGEYFEVTNIELMKTKQKIEEIEMRAAEKNGCAKIKWLIRVTIISQKVMTCSNDKRMF